jgi:hypothetical protein
MKNSNERFTYNSFAIQSFSSGQLYYNKGEKDITYHYTSPDAFLSIVQNHTIRFTDIRYLNDRSEGIYFVKLLLDFIDKNKNKYPYFEEAVNRLLKENDLNKIKNLEITSIKYNDIPRMPYKPERVFVFCTCTEADSLNMWNYYVNNGSYQGYNIGFRISELLKAFDTPSENQADTFIVHYGKVLYTEKEHFTEIQHLAESMERNITFNSSISNVVEEQDILFAQMKLRSYIDSHGAFYKHPKFESEKEFRIIIEIADERIPRTEENAKKYFGEYNQKMVEGFCTKRGLVIPFLTVTFPEKAIYRVTVAPMIEYDIAKNSVRELLSISKIEGVRIDKSTVPIRF